MSSTNEILVTGTRRNAIAEPTPASSVLMRPWFFLWMYAESGTDGAPAIASLTFTIEHGGHWREIHQSLEYGQAMKILDQFLEDGILADGPHSALVAIKSDPAAATEDRLWVRFRRDAGSEWLAPATVERLQLGADSAHDVRRSLRNLIDILPGGKETEAGLAAVRAFIENYPH